MNGRVYDPRIGRFVSPDPIIQAPSFSQSYNRYAYVFNNPLSHVDPTGFWSLNKLAKGIGGAVGSVFKGIGKALGNALEKIGRFVKQNAVDIAITLAAFMIPGGPAIEGMRGFVIRSAVATAGVTSRRQSRAGPEPGGVGTPGIAGVLSFGPEGRSRGGSVKLEELEGMPGDEARAKAALEILNPILKQRLRRTVPVRLEIIDDQDLKDDGIVFFDHRRGTYIIRIRGGALRSGTPGDGYAVIAHELRHLVVMVQ